MRTYAISMACVGQFLTEPLADAFRRSKFRSVELSFYTCVEKTQEARISGEITRRLIREKIMIPASVHLPFYGGGLSWDPSEPEEDKRRETVSRFIRLIRENADLMAPQVTLHASNEPPPAEHPRRIDQVCRTLEDLQGIAEELDFSINVEFLPRTCVGNSVEELWDITSRFDPARVGICLDVNHIMNRWHELPEIIKTLAPRIRTFHLCDYDGVDENHWMPGDGIIDWRKVMKSIKAIEHDVLLIFETKYFLDKWGNRAADPIFALRQNEHACYFLENCDTIIPRREAFVIPGNSQHPCKS